MPLSKTVVLRNRSNAPFTANCLRGVDYGPDLQPVPFAATFPNHAKDGTVGMEIVERELPAAVSWLPGESKECPASVLEIPDVKRAIPHILVVVR